MSFLDAARARARLLFGNDDAEARMNDEIAFHVEMETERLQKEEGLDAIEARRRANVAFGPAEAHKEELRHNRGLAWLGGLKLDLKLGARMLVKYPGLTLVGGIAMAFAIWLGSVVFVMVDQVLNPTLPFPEGDRVVRIVSWDEKLYDEENRSLSDYAIWRDEVRSITDLGAYRDVGYNLIVGDDAAPVTGAQISASAFDIASVPPLYGRVLEPSDEEPGAAPVVVIGHRVWRERFGSDPNVVGTGVQLDDAFVTVVGVMPEGFGFPIAHELWTPLRENAAVWAPRQGPPIGVFGRLAPDATLERAQVELDQIGSRLAAAQPKSHEHLRAYVVPYTDRFPPNELDEVLLLASVDVIAVLLLIVICSNVALLVFARAVAREGELVVRSALGATRGRIVGQLFAEALVLGLVAAAVGLAVAQYALGAWGAEFLRQNGNLPFWYELGLSPLSLAYTIGLTLLAAAIAGMIPARKITGGLGTTLRASSAGGGGLRFGGIWTAVIVTQIALTVAFPVFAYAQRRGIERIEAHDVGFASEQYLGIELDMDATEEKAVRFASALHALRQRVAAEPGVAGITFVDRMPRDYHVQHWIELDDPSGTGWLRQNPDIEVSSATIDPSYFDVLGAPVREGRGFTPADATPEGRAIIVDQGFVDVALEGRNALGRRVRFSELGEWSMDDARPAYEIVGVVPELGLVSANDRDRHAGVYFAAATGAVAPVNMLVHAPDDPMGLAARIHELAAAVDPTLRIARIQRADQVVGPQLSIEGMWLKLTIVLTAIVLLLSLAGIYAVMSFTVTRRTREIGVRVALGGSPRHVVAAILRKPLRQVMAGVAVGFVLVTSVAFAVAGQRPDGASRVKAEMLGIEHLGMFAAYAALMFGVCMTACLVPTMRALRVQPVDALRADS